MADNDEKILKTLEDLKQGQERIEIRQKKLGRDIEVLGMRVDHIETDLNLLKKYSRNTDKTQKQILNFLDKQDVALQKRVSRLEEHAGISSVN